MFTLIYFNGKFNRPETLLPFLQSNMGESPLLQIDCVTPYKGSEKDLIRDVLKYFEEITKNIVVSYNTTLNSSTESSTGGVYVTYLVIQINVSDIC